MNKKFLFLILFLVFSVNVSAQENASLNYVWNESCTAGDCWVPWIADNTGKPKVDLNLLNITAENASLADSLIANYIFPYTLASTLINNLSVTNDVTTIGNITSSDSVNSDYIFPKSASFTRIDNITILQDLRVLGSSYLGSFIIKDDLSVGQTNISSTNTGIGTLSPGYLLHLNISDDLNETITELLVLEKTNLSTGSGDGYGSSILFRLQDNAGEMENISMISGILSDVSNGTERGDLVFYTGYGDVNGIISNLSSAEKVRIDAQGRVGIGTAGPTHTLNVAGDANITSDLNVEGFSITDDSLVTLANGSRKKIKDIKAEEVVLTLDESTGKLVARKVNALLDHGIKPIYEMATEDGRSINTTGEHPYYTKSDPMPDKISKASEGVITLSGKASFNPLSPDNILQLNLRDRATYGTSFKCGAIDTASPALSSNTLNGIISTDLLMNSIISKISPLESFDIETILSRLLSNSEYMYCVEMNSNFSNISFNSKTKRDLPFVANAENTTLKSTTSIIFYDTFLPSKYFTRAESRNLLEMDKLTSSANSLACFSVSLDFETIDSIFFISNNFSLNSSFKNLENNSCHIFSGISLPSIASNSLLTSFGTLNNNSAILTSQKINNENSYLKLSNSASLGEWTEVRHLKVGDEIAVPDYSTNTIKWKKISSIKILEPQHVYDLSIEGTRNFIANDIIAHNTYLAGNVSLADNFTVDGSTFYVDASSNNVGIGTTSPTALLDVYSDAGNLDLNVSGNLYVNSTNVMIGDMSSNITNLAEGGLAVRSTVPGKFTRLQLFAEPNDDDNTNTITFYNSTNQLYAFVTDRDANKGENLDIHNRVGTSLMTWTQTGNVGIGTTGPDAANWNNENPLLHLSGTRPMITMTDTDGQEYSLISQTDGFQIYDANGSATRFFIEDTTGNVGIGTTAPTHKLNVDGTANFTKGNFLIENSSGSLGLFYQETDNQVGIGTTSPQSKFHVEGSIRVGGETTANQAIYSAGGNHLYVMSGTGGGAQLIFGNGTAASDQVSITTHMSIDDIGNILMPNLQTTAEDVAACFIASTGELIEDSTTTCASSSKRYKTDIQPLNYGLNEILQLQPSWFTLKSNGRRGMGLIAEDVELVMPELVAYDAEGNVDTLHFYDLNGPIIKSIQELNSKISTLEQKNMKLEQEVKTLKEAQG